MAEDNSRMKSRFMKRGQRCAVRSPLSRAASAWGGSFLGRPGSVDLWQGQADHETQAKSAREPASIERHRIASGRRALPPSGDDTGDSEQQGT